MRNTIKTLAVLLIVLSSVKSYAKADSLSAAAFCKVVAQEIDHSYKLIYNGAQTSDVMIQWIDENNEVVFKENVKAADKFVKQYDLSSLPDGKYTVSLSAGSYDYSYSEVVELGDISGFQYFIKTSADRNVVLTGMQPTGKSATVVILDGENDVIFKESLDAAESVQKKYNFKGIDSDKVTFMVYYNDRIVKEESVAL